MIKSTKVQLLPNNKQKSKLYQSVGTSRFAYNWALSKQMENFKSGNKFISENELRKEFTQIKKQTDYKWLNNYSNNITKQAIKDCCIAYENFFNKQKKSGYVKYTEKQIQKAKEKDKKLDVYDMQGHPKYKSKKDSEQGFYVDTSKIKFNETHVKLEKLADSKKKNKQMLNWVKLSEKNRIPINFKYLNPRVKFDVINYFVSVGTQIDIHNTTPNIETNKGVGIDLGIKNLAICSDGEVYKNINKSQKVKKLKKKQRRLQRKISRKYLNNKKGESYCKTRNIIKSEKQLLKLNHKLSNIRLNYLHQTTTEIIKRKPSFIVLEDLNVKGMMKNKHLAKAISEQCFYEFYRQISYKSNWNNIKFVEAERFYPSSKKCSQCGKIKSDLKLSDRMYICECGNKIDRDYNASLNLKNYGLTKL